MTEPQPNSPCPDCPDFQPDSIYHLHQHLADAHGIERQEEPDDE